MYQDRTPSLSGAFLKHVAIITMLIDHIGYGIVGRYIIPLYGEPYEDIYVLLREVGRLAFPIFCFLIIEGARHTSNRTGYLMNLSIFALVSEIPFDLLYREVLFYPDYQNVFFTLALGLSAIYICDIIKDSCHRKDLSKTSESLFLLLGLIPFLIVAFILRSDYGATGVLLIFLIWVFRGNYRIMMIAGVLTLTVINTAESALIGLFDTGMFPPLNGLLQKLPSELASVISFSLISMYNGKRGRQLPKYIYYAFYPAHLAAIYALGRLIF